MTPPVLGDFRVHWHDWRHQRRHSDQRVVAASVPLCSARPGWVWKRLLTVGYSTGPRPCDCSPPSSASPPFANSSRPACRNVPSTERSSAVSFPTVLPGVVELAEFPPTFRQRAMAAQLFGGDGSFLAGTTAARLYGIRGMPQRLIELVTITRRRGPLPDWLERSFSTWTDRRPGRRPGGRSAHRCAPANAARSRRTTRRCPVRARRRGCLAPASDHPARAAEYLNQIAAPGRRRGRQDATAGSIA